MSEQRLPAAWSRDLRPPAAPVREPVVRHPVLEGLAAFDWQWRHRSALKRLSAQLAAAAGDTQPLAAGDLDIDTLRRVATELAAGNVAGVEPALALLLGSYVALPAGADREAVVLAAATAARLGISVHVGGLDAAVTTAIAERLRALLGDSVFVTELREQAAPASVVAWPVHGIVCGPLNVFALAWLRLGGATRAVTRAAAVLGGEAGAAYPQAPLLLLVDGDQLLLDVVRQPLQITDDAIDDSVRMAREALQLVAGWHAGTEYEGDAPRAAGLAQIAAVQRERGGVWSVPRVRDEAVRAALTVRRFEDGRDYRLDGVRVQWLAEHALDDDFRPAVERALVCRHGKDARRVRRRVSLLDFLDGYPRLGAVGAQLDDEWRDLWLLHGIPVLQPAPAPPALQWQETPAGSLLPVDADAGGIPVFAANRRLVEENGALPADTPVLDQAEARARLAAVIAEGGHARVVGIPVARRLVPAGVSAIILAADDPGIAPWLRRLALKVLRFGRPGRAVAQRLADIAVWQVRRQRYRLRAQLARRRDQERRTWAFAAGAVANEQEKTR